MKICLFDIEPWERDSFEPLQQEHEIIYRKESLDAQSAADCKGADIISVFIYSRLNAETLQQLPALKMIATRSTGFDHIDREYCERNGITVANVPSYGENTVAEHVFALLLALSHRMVEAVQRTRRGDFSSRGLQGFDLMGKTLGVVGTGNIGRHVIRIARGFDMPVIASDIQPDRALAERLQFRYGSLREVLQQADIMTLHVPGNEATENLIAADEFAVMKQGSILINTSRGAVVDVQALLHALADGTIAAAGLDVLPDEPVIREEAELLHAVFDEQNDLQTLLADHVLLQHMDNVIITPHSAFNTREAVQRILETTRDNITGFVAGEPANTVVTA